MVTGQDSTFQIGCIGFKGVIDIDSANVKPSTTSIPLYDPQDPNIDGKFSIVFLFSILDEQRKIAAFQVFIIRIVFKGCCSPATWHLVIFLFFILPCILFWVPCFILK